MGGILPIVGTNSPANVGTSWCDTLNFPGGDAHPIPDHYDPAVTPTEWDAQPALAAPYGSDEHQHSMSTAGQVETRVYEGHNGSEQSDLMAERVRGLDTRHATWSQIATSRPWETDYPTDWGGIGGAHGVQVPGAAESRGVLHQNTFEPAQLTTRVPPMPWDEPTRLPAPSPGA